MSSFNQSLWLSLPNELRSIINDDTQNNELISVEEIDNSQIKFVVETEQDILVERQYHQIPVAKITDWLKKNDIALPKNIIAKFCY